MASKSNHMEYSMWSFWSSYSHVLRVKFYTCMHICNSAYISIMWNSISGLDSLSHFRFGVSCTVRSHENFLSHFHFEFALIFEVFFIFEVILIFVDVFIFKVVYILALTMTSNIKTILKINRGLKCELT